MADVDVDEVIAFVAGATGLTGRLVVEALAHRGGSAIAVAHVRPDSPLLEEHRARFEALGARVDATPWEEEAMARALERWRPRAVFALLGTTRARARREGRGRADEAYEAVDYGLTALLLRAATRLDPPPRFVYLSSTGVTEGTRNAYLAVRARLERELRESGLPYAIARPSFIVGEREPERRWEGIAAKLGDGALAAAGALGAAKLRDRYRSIEASALAEALVRLAFEPDVAGRVVEANELQRLASR
jgi:nucleoside-diphosphate-sugar epimerase